jgi:ribonuclease J
MGTHITVYGGAAEIGGNKILLEEGETRVLLDFGTSFGERARYFEEFLVPRASLGLLDPLVMDLLPPLRGLYRGDLLISPEVWGRMRRHPHYREIPEVHGILLSHAHLDHSGAIAFLKETIPVYATRMTAFIAKAMEDVGSADLEREVVYTSPRLPTDDSTLASDRTLYVQRPFVLVDGVPQSQEALRFWGASPTKTKVLRPASLLSAEKVGELVYRFFYVDHSIFGSCAFAVETSAGWVVYTGDLRLHGSHGHLTETFVREAAALRPAILLCEGTNVAREASAEAQTSEEAVHERALAVIGAARGLVIADFSPRHIERLLTFYRIARETSRILVILVKDQYLLDAMRLASGGPWALGDMEDVRIYAERKGTRSTVEDRIRYRYAARLVSPEQIRADPAHFILCLSFFDVKHLIDIDPLPGGLYVYSSSEAYEEEQVIDQRRLRNWLERFGFEHVGFERSEGLHASGHAGSVDLVRMVQEIAPRALIPVHSKTPELYAEHLAGTGIEVIVPQAGVRIAV